MVLSHWAVKHHQFPKNKPKGNSAWERCYHKCEGTSCINKAYLCKFYKTLAHRGFHSGIINSVNKLNIGRDHILWIKSFRPAFLLQFTLQLGHGSGTGAHRKLQQVDMHTATGLIYLGTNELRESGSSSSTQNPSCSIIPAAAAAWAKQHSRTMAGHMFFGGYCRPRTISSTTLDVDNLFWDAKVHLWGPEKDSWLVEMWSPQTFTYLSLRLNYQRKKPKSLMYVWLQACLLLGHHKTDRN